MGGGGGYDDPAFFNKNIYISSFLQFIYKQVHYPPFRGALM
jgi:hypothetical protein